MELSESQSAHLLVADFQEIIHAHKGDYSAEQETAVPSG